MAKGVSWAKGIYIVNTPVGQGNINCGHTDGPMAELVDGLL